MTLETKTNLDEQTIAKLQNLIRANIDACDGLKQAEKKVDDKAVAALFRELAGERSAMASELQNHVEWNGVEAVDDGSIVASVHRAWLNVRAKLASGDTYVVLAEAEKGEDYIKQAYEEVLKETAGSAMNDVLTEQYACVKLGHDRIRDLRDSYKS